ncbi:uncharacterized protein LOC143908921 [Arctopsyche grandis]|uniref:uncharacterized protein LOC143908921 n=1 Tax=Arctopsyche grandis TaxID=121162 RepID=UPI00406D9298
MQTQPEGVESAQALCRACLRFSQDIISLKIPATAATFAFCTSLQVTESESLPKTMCNMCFDLLNKFSDFKLLCIKSDFTLRNCETFNGNKYDDIKVELLDSFDSNSKLKLDEFESILKKSDNSDEEVLNETNFIPDFDVGRKIDSVFEIPKSMIKNNKKRKSKDRRLKSMEKKCMKKKNKNRYTCSVCNKKFGRAERFEAHKLTHHEVSFQSHQSIHINKFKSLECVTCGKKYKTTATLRNHQKIHRERKDYVCHICGGSFRSSAGLQSHVDTHQENREKNHECKICGKKFVTSNYLTSHMFRHKERRFVCQHCRFPFFTKTDLARHMLIHKGIKPYVCDICNKAYSTKSFLVEHGRMHSGERPFACDYCTMKFISKRRLIDHTRTHTGEKPHKCDKCNQAFIQRGSLTRHLKVHEK